MQKIAYGSENLKIKIGNLALQPFILANSRSVITVSSLQKVLGYDGKSEEWLFDLLGSINKFFPISGDLFAAHENPTVVETNGRIYTALDSAVVEKTCKIIVSAKIDGYLSVSQLKFAKGAAAILNSLQQKGFEHAVAESTGYNFTKENAKLAIAKVLALNDPNRSNLFEWVRTLPEPFFESVMILNEIDWKKILENPYTFAEIIHEIVFSRIPETLLTKLDTERPKRTYKSKAGIPDNCHPDLTRYTVELESLMVAAAGNWQIFEQLLERVHPKTNLLKKLPQRSHEAPLGLFDQQLLQGVTIERKPIRHQ